MASRSRNRLTALGVKALKEIGKHADGGGLYLRIGTDTRRWIFRYRDPRTGKTRDRGLGAAADVTLEQARRRADECRQQLRAGVDPVDDNRKARSDRAIAKARIVTFADAAKSFIDAKQSEWRNEKHVLQWRSTMQDYAEPIIGRMNVADIVVGDVLKIIEPLWQAGKVETGKRVRQRIQNILDWCIARGHRTADNCARWTGLLDKLLPNPRKVAPLRHQPSLPYHECPAFMQEIRGRDGFAARALELMILCATRAGETVGARWSEIDLEKATWVIPAERTKSHREFSIPLASDVVTMLRTLPRISGNEFVFPGLKNGTCLSIAAPYSIVKQLRPQASQHGFRSSFRVFCSERTNVSREVAEFALNHVTKDQTEAAYLRTTAFEKRRALMAQWARYLSTPTTSATVTSIAGKKATAA